MSFVQAAKVVGLEIKHSGVRRLMQNPRYLGDDFYPAILTVEIAQTVEDELLRRDALYKGTRHTKKAVTTVIPTRFSMKRTAPKFKDPIKQAEYAYSQIKEAKQMQALAQNVTVIPARRRVGSQRTAAQVQKIRVAAYRRVSTDSEEQETSY